MEFGLFSNGERGNRNAADTYDEDLLEVRNADKYGFREAWISEHVGRAKAFHIDNVAAADLFIVRAAALTKRIKLGPAVRPIALYDPIQVAIEANMCDQLTRGRYMFGFGIGGPDADGITMRGLGDPGLDARRERVHEAWTLIRKCWEEEEPFDFDGKFYHGKNIRVTPRPYSKPHCEVGVAVSTNAETAQIAGAEGMYPLFSQYSSPGKIKDFSEAFVAGAEAAGRKAHRSDIRACRYVYVSENTKKAKEELRATITPSIERHKRDFPHHFKESLPPSGDVMDITWDFLVDSGYYFVGDPDTVAEHIENHYNEAGGFGVFLCLMGKNYGTSQQRGRSMKLFMQEVAPRLASLDPDRGRQLAEVL